MNSEFNLHIVRILQLNDGILGELYINGKLIACTLERPWLNNAKKLSSIPEGTYGANLRTEKSRDLYFTLELTGTQPRDSIQIHVGNEVNNSTGCILVGLSARYSEMKLEQSKVAIENMKSIFYGDDAILTPDKVISVRVTAAPIPMRFYPQVGQNKTYFFVYDKPNWYLRGASYPEIIFYKEILRDTKWIIMKANGGAFDGLYIRWGTLGGTPFQASKDLKTWKNFGSPDEVMVREPQFYDKQTNVFSNLTKRINNGLFPRKLKGLYADDGHGHDDGTGDGYGDEDGREDGVISYDFEDEGDAVGPDWEDSDAYDDYSAADDDRGDGGGDGD